MAVTVHAQRRRRTLRSQRLWLPYLFLLPSVTIFVVLMAYPMLKAIYLSFESWDGLRPAKWVGLANYWNLLHDRIFVLALQHTAYFAIVTVILQTVIPLLVASLLNSGIRGSVLF